MPELFHNPQTLPQDELSQVPLFNHEFAPSEYRSKLVTFEGDPAVNYIVRTLESFEPGTPESEIENSRLSAEQKLVDLAASGVKIAPAFIQKGVNRDGRPATFILVRDMGGKNVYDSSFVNRPDAHEIGGKFDRLMGGLSSYFLAKIEAGEPFLDDIDMLDQYVFTGLQAGGDSDFYLVDAEPSTSQSTNLDARNYLSADLRTMVEMMERRLPGDTVLTASRQAAAGVIDAILKKYPNNAEELSKIREELLSGYNGYRTGERIDTPPSSSRKRLIAELMKPKGPLRPPKNP